MNGTSDPAAPAASAATPDDDDYEVTDAERHAFFDRQDIAYYHVLTSGSWWFRGGRMTPLAIVSIMLTPLTAVMLATMDDPWKVVTRSAAMAVLTYVFWYAGLVWPAARAARAAERRQAS